MAERKLIQVGIKALRTPTGEFMEAMPIYMEASSDMEEREETVINALDDVVIRYLKDYIDKRKKLARRSEPEVHEMEIELPLVFEDE